MRHGNAPAGLGARRDAGGGRGMIRMAAKRAAAMFSLARISEQGAPYDRKKNPFLRNNRTTGRT